MHEFGQKYLTNNEQEEAYGKGGCFAMKIQLLEIKS